MRLPLQHKASRVKGGALSWNISGARADWRTLVRPALDQFWVRGHTIQPSSRALLHATSQAAVRNLAMFGEVMVGKTQLYVSSSRRASDWSLIA